MDSRVGIWVTGPDAWVIYVIYGFNVDDREYTNE